MSTTGAPKICLSEAMYEHLASDLGDLVGGAEFVRVQPDGSLLGDPDGVEVFCFSVDLADSDETMMTAAGLLGAPELEWVQAPSAGVEHEIWAQLLERGVRVSSAAGVHAEPIAQYVFAHVLHDLRDIERHREQQSARRWERIVSDDAAAKSIGIVGMGGIGRSVARIAKAFGMTVLALRRGTIEDPNVDFGFGPDGLHEMLRRCDYVVLTLPLTPETTGLFDSAAFAAMGESALLVNVARGGVVVEADLISALRTHSIRGAVLDVVATEPLPEDSPLWDLDNCVITPHDAGYSPLAGARLGELFVENLRCWLRGEELRNELVSA